MSLYLVIVLLWITILTNTQSNQGTQQDRYFVTPALPPTAFLGNYYTAQFRVIGLDNPRFTFHVIPPWFNGFSNGTVEGTPLNVGSFPLQISYQSGGVSGNQQVVIRVANSSPNGSLLFNSVKFAVISPSGYLTYSVGNFITLRFQAQNGKTPYIWTFTNLPPGLLADMNGNINGTFIQQGYYTFSASAADGTGKTADSYFTINVQPRGVTNKSLVEVPIRNVPVQYNLDQLQQQELEATKAVYAAIGQVYKHQNETNSLREIVAKTTLILTMAEDQAKRSLQKLNSITSLRDLAETLSSKANIVLKNIKNAVDLATTSNNNAINTASATVKLAQQASKKFQQSTKNLTESNNAFINAQTQSMQAAVNVKGALTKNADAYNVYNLTYKTYEQSKQILSDQLDKKNKADLIVNAASTQREAAMSINSNAQAALIMSQDTYQKAFSAFNNSLIAASNIASQLKDADYALGVAKFNLQQATNTLFVAQAAKEQADKLTAIITTQSSTLPQSDSSEANHFEGCDQGAYPTMMGSTWVKQVNNFGLKLASDQIILFGSCTIKDSLIKVGDLITYVGFLKNGKIQGQQIVKLLI